ncbi:Uncharacterised protein [Candidatus Norongarragalina meridionalis]|nr:Uncharacterised protein [Candidatus Norongarragalina meridionalis]
MFGKIVYETLSHPKSHYVLCEAGIIMSAFEGAKIGDVVEMGSNARVLSGAEAAPAEKAIAALITSKSVSPSPRLLVDDACMHSLPFASCATFIKKALLDMTPIIMRWHDDCDGVSSALLLDTAITNFIKQNRIPYTRGMFVKKQADSAIYDDYAARQDADESLAFPKKPLLILLDHGANGESMHAVKNLKQSGFQILIIDHHPPSSEAKGVVDFFLSPFTVEGGGSSHTAGLLSFEVASCFGPADERLARWSLQSDHSEFRGTVEDKEPVVIDYLAISEKHSTLDDYRRLLSSPPSVMFTHRKALTAVENALKAAEINAREVKIADGVSMALFRLDFLRKGAYPSKGKVINAFQRKHEEGKALVSVGYDDSNALFRVSEQAHERGFKANELIAELKAEMPHAVESGGGHERAASARFKAEFSESVMNAIIELAKKRLS